MKNNKELKIVRYTFVSKTTSENKQILSAEFTEHIKSITPDGYHLKQMPKYNDEYAEIDGVHRWRVEYAVIFVEN